MKKGLLSILLAAVFASCSAPSSLSDMKFNLTELNGTPLEYVGEEPSFISFEGGADGGHCYAYVGGNRIFAVYSEGEDNTIVFTEGGATKMMVDPETREDEFLEAFNAVSSYKLEDDVISFYNVDGDLLFKGTKVE